MSPCENFYRGIAFVHCLHLCGRYFCPFCTITHLPERFPLHFFSVEEAFEKGEGGGGGSGGHGGARWEGENEEPATPARQGSSTRAAYGEDTIFSRIARQSGTAFWHTARRARNVNKTAKRTARPVTESAALARARVRRFSIFSFTASPTCRNALCTTALGVKTLGAYLHLSFTRGFTGALAGIGQFRASPVAPAAHGNGRRAEVTTEVKAKTQSLHPQQLVCEHVAWGG